MIGGANPNALFIAMMALNQLREIGLTPVDKKSDSDWHRADLVEPTVPDAKPHGLGLIPAGAQMLAWKARGRDH